MYFRHSHLMKCCTCRLLYAVRKADSKVCCFAVSLFSEMSHIVIVMANCFVKKKKRVTLFYLSVQICF